MNPLACMQSLGFRNARADCTRKSMNIEPILWKTQLYACSEDFLRSGAKSWRVISRWGGWVGGGREWEGHILRQEVPLSPLHPLSGNAGKPLKSFKISRPQRAVVADNDITLGSDQRRSSTVIDTTLITNSPTGNKSWSLDDDDERCESDVGRSSKKTWAA